MRGRRASLAATAAIIATAILTGTAMAAKPARDGGSFTETYFDDLIWELCGIETLTTLTQTWSVKDFADGSAMVHVVRTFVPDDARIPVEKGAAQTFIGADGSRRVVGMPLLLFYPDGGAEVLASGNVLLDPDGNVVFEHGRTQYLDQIFSDDLAEFYCPAEA
jgi:hypothetical protein